MLLLLLLLSHFSRVRLCDPIDGSPAANGWGKEFWRSAKSWTSWELGIINLKVLFFFPLGERVLCFA